MEWLIQVPSVLIAFGALWIAWKAHGIADRAEKRAAAADERARVRFQFDSQESVEGVYEGAVRIRLLHVGTLPTDFAQIEQSSLSHWEIHHTGHPFNIAPGERVEVTLRPNFRGELPEQVTVRWRVGKDEGEQVVPLPADPQKNLSAG